VGLFLAPGTVFSQYQWPKTRQKHDRAASDRHKVAHHRACIWRYLPGAILAGKRPFDEPTRPRDYDDGSSCRLWLRRADRCDRHQPQQWRAADEVSSASASCLDDSHDSGSGVFHCARTHFFHFVRVNGIGMLDTARCQYLRRRFYRLSCTRKILCVNVYPFPIRRSSIRSLARLN
jgi:hypothetical protein